MPTMRFRIHISPEKYLAYYNGSARFVHVHAEDGRSLKFPARELQRFVSHGGIQGRFEIEFDLNHKLVRLDKIG